MIYNTVFNENRSHLHFGTIMTLADLAPGETAKLDKIDTSDPGVIRLMILRSGIVVCRDIRSNYFVCSSGLRRLSFRSCMVHSRPLHCK